MESKGTDDGTILVEQRLKHQYACRAFLDLGVGAGCVQYPNAVNAVNFTKGSKIVCIK
jgi:hypothetical protein